MDLFFAFGRKILFQLALAIFKINEKVILDCSDSIELIFTIKESLADLDSNLLVRVCYFLKKSYRMNPIYIFNIFILDCI